MNSNKYCIILAGGAGNRLWPMSRESKPKQFLDPLGCGKTLIRQTYERFLPIISPSNFLVLTTSRYKSLVMEQIPEIEESQILCEPINRNTAPCIAYAASYLLSINPEAEMVVTPADHFITGEGLFLSTVEAAFDFVAEGDSLLTVGVTPSRAETAYGYIQMSDQSPISKVKCFTEKPNADMAETFVECGEFLWNSGLFVWRADSIMRAFEAHHPEIYNIFSSIDCYRTEREEEAVRNAFTDCKSISIDYAILERADNVYVSTANFGWCDVGTWSALFEHAILDDGGNRQTANSHTYNTSGTIISAAEEKVVVVSGLTDYIVVDTDDILMICPRSEEQSVRTFSADIQYRNS